MANSTTNIFDYSWLNATSVLTLTGLGAVALYLLKMKPKAVKMRCDLSQQSLELEDSVRASKLYNEEKFMVTLFDDVKTLCDVLPRGATETKDGRCMARINKKTNTCEWSDYTDILGRIENCGSGLRHIGLDAGSNTFIGIYATNSIEYVILEYACYNYSMVVVPLYDTLGPNACSFIINQASIPCVVCDTVDRVQALVSQANNLKTLKHIIVTEDIPESYKSKAMSYGIKVLTLKQVEKMGQSNPAECLMPQPEDLAVICYTSGTTGNPKGAMLTHGNIIANVSAVMFQLSEYAPHSGDTMISFLPLAHMFERCCEAALFMVGAKIAFYSGNIKNLTDDLKIIRPTVIPVVPRLLNRIYDKVQVMTKGNKLKSWLLNKALKSKMNELQKGIIRNNSIWDKIVFRSVRNGLGGKVRLMVIGGAKTSENVLDFIRCALGCVVTEGYGQTECVCPCTFTLPGDPEAGHVGPPVSACHIKLVDVPEMEYYASDDKGEICVKGPIVFKGYFADPIKTSDVIDSEGWLHTGDIGTWLPNGTLRIIDRRKHIFKLSQGEYIAPEKIETIYIRSPFVAQIFIYGESIKSCLVAVIVPENEYLLSWCRKQNIRGTLRDLCQNPKVKQAVMKDLLALGRKDGLHAFEQPKDIYIHPEAFTVDNGLLTPTLKTRRPQLRKFFICQLEEMYRTLD